MTPLDVFGKEFLSHKGHPSGASCLWQWTTFLSISR